jgi:hypothetical protein
MGEPAKRCVRPAGTPTEPSEEAVKARTLCLCACTVVAALGAAPLRAADAPSHPPTQREKFAACAHETRGMKAEERRAFMSECLKKPEASRPAKSAAADASHARASCDAQADRRKLQGEARRAFLGACIEG